MNKFINIFSKIVTVAIVMAFAFTSVAHALETGGNGNTASDSAPATGSNGTTASSDTGSNGSTGGLPTGSNGTTAGTDSTGAPATGSNGSTAGQDTTGAPATGSNGSTAGTDGTGSNPGNNNNDNGGGSSGSRRSSGSSASSYADIRIINVSIVPAANGKLLVSWNTVPATEGRVVWGATSVITPTGAANHGYTNGTVFGAEMTQHSVLIDTTSNPLFVRVIARDGSNVLFGTELQVTTSGVASTNIPVTPSARPAVGTQNSTGGTNIDLSIPGTEDTGGVISTATSTDNTAAAAGSSFGSKIAAFFAAIWNFIWNILKAIGRAIASIFR